MVHVLIKISDHALPDLIGRAIMHNANAVLELQTVKDKLVKLEREHARLTEEFNTLSRLQVNAFVMCSIFVNIFMITLFA